MHFSITHVKCDCCGGSIDKRSHAFVDIFGPSRGRIDLGSDLWDSWSPAGDYCDDCLKKMMDRIISYIEGPGGYKDRKDVIAHEISLIEGTNHGEI